MSKNMMYGAIIIALLVGAFGGYYYEKTKLTTRMSMMQADMQKQVDDTNMKYDQLMKTQTAGTDKMMQPSSEPTGAMMKTNTSPTEAMMKIIKV